MPRLYHSPSSIELGRRCKRAWYYRYVEGIRKPEEPWVPGVKGARLGTAIHATLEAYYTPGMTPDWLWFPGEVAASGERLLPEPSASLAIEKGLGESTGQSIGPGHDGHERFTVTIAGVPWLGYRDLVDYRPPYARLFDYKSTASIQRYAKSTAELLQDLQANLYAYDTMTEIGASELFCRWVYFETGKVRRAEPRDFVVRRAEAFGVIECAAEVAKEIDVIDHIDQAPMNTLACADFGGCEFHEKAGGPCSARVAVGALIQARVPKPIPKEGINPMPLDKSKLVARFGNAPGAAPSPPPAADPPPASDPPNVEAGATDPTPNAEPGSKFQAAAAARRGRPAKAAGSFGELAQALAAAEAVAAEASVALDTAKDAMRKALA